MSDDIISIRHNKINSIKQLGMEPFGRKFDKAASLSDIKSGYQESKAVKVAGRVISVREHGKTLFYDIKDHTAKLQLYAGKDSPNNVFSMRELIDVGDIIGAEGELFKTRTGEITVNVKVIVILSKSLLPMPEKWHGLKDVETRYRQRYLDLIANDDVKNIFYMRTQVIRGIRKFFDERGYLEVETPMLQPMAGGAAGRPFKTHHNVYDKDLYLRIAPELYLKRLLVGGFEKVYEINKSFRNEGISPRHNPEFTMLESYTAYADYSDLIVLTEQLISGLAKEIFGDTRIIYQSKTIDLTPPWDKISFAGLMKELYGITAEDDINTWIEKLTKKGVKVEGKKIGRTKLVNIIADVIEPKSNTGKPVFVTDYFTELCPLAKTKKDDPAISERFELYIAGMEVANAYSELNNPIEQKQRFIEQLENEAEGTNREQGIDEDYVRALEYGMPPAAGLGIGIDRLVMLFANQESIRDVILFPQLKPE